MNVKELIEELKKMPQDAEIWHLWDGAARTRSWHWEPEMNPAMAKDNTGYCHIINNRTTATHGKQCAADKPIIPHF